MASCFPGCRFELSANGMRMVVRAMNDDIQAAGKLLAELREAYRGLPKHMQERVANLLRESAPPERIDEKRTR